MTESSKSNNPPSDDSSSEGVKKPKVTSSVFTGTVDAITWDSERNETTPDFTPLGSRSPVGSEQCEKKEEEEGGETEQKSPDGSSSHDSGDEEDEGGGKETSDEQKEIARIALGLEPPSLPDPDDD